MRKIPVRYKLLCACNANQHLSNLTKEFTFIYLYLDASFENFSISSAETEEKLRGWDSKEFLLRLSTTPDLEQWTDPCVVRDAVRLAMTGTYIFFVAADRICPHNLHTSIIVANTIKQTYNALKQKHQQSYWLQQAVARPCKTNNF